MVDHEARSGAEAARRRDELLGKYRGAVKAALAAKTPTECRTAVAEARKLLESAKLAQEKLREAKRAAIEELERWKEGTDATWEQVERVAEDQLIKLEALLESVKDVP